MEITYDVTFLLSVSSVLGREQYRKHSSANEQMALKQRLAMKVQNDVLQCN
jgi:hypothetical protein